MSRLSKFMFSLFVLVIASAFISSTLVNAQPEKVTAVVVIPEEIQFPSTKKPMKIFTHLDHSVNLNNDCQVCHHAGKVDAKCLSCHNINNPDVGEIVGSKKTFHGNCMPCHKDLAKENGKKTKCSDCHKKKKRKVVLEGC